MSDTLADLASWLPSDFLSDNIDNKNTPLFPNNTLCYPCDHFGSCSSTESESDDDDVTGLARSFTRSLSLQMTHNNHHCLGFTGPALAKSTPTTPFGGLADEDSWERLHAAAAQIAEMKMMKMNPDGLFGPTRPGGAGPTSYHPSSGLQMREQYLRRAGNFNPPLGFRQSAWGPLPLENKRRQQTINGPFVTNRGPHVVKRECAGTGVFLPRSYVPEPPEYKKPQGRIACSSPGLLPARLEVQSYNKGLVDPTIIPQHQPPPNIHGVFGPPQQLNIINAHSAKLLMARRNAALLAQQRRNTAYISGISDDVVLPQEWTY